MRVPCNNPAKEKTKAHRSEKRGTKIREETDRGGGEREKEREREKDKKMNTV